MRGGLRARDGGGRACKAQRSSGQGHDSDDSAAGGDDAATCANLRPRRGTRHGSAAGEASAASAESEVSVARTREQRVLRRDGAATGASSTHALPQPGEAASLIIRLRVDHEQGLAELCAGHAAAPSQPRSRAS